MWKFYWYLILKVILLLLFCVALLTSKYLNLVSSERKYWYILNTATIALYFTISTAFRYNYYSFFAVLKTLTRYVPSLCRKIWIHSQYILCVIAHNVVQTSQITNLLSISHVKDFFNTLKNNVLLIDTKSAINFAQASERALCEKNLRSSFRNK